MEVKIKSLAGGGLPEYQTNGAAGVDLCAAVGGALAAGETKVIGTGLAMQIPDGFAGYVCSRSGLALKHSVFVLNAPGVIDSDYRGEIGVILHNAGSVVWGFKEGDRIAQMVFSPIARASFLWVADLEDTLRGTGGFGSTGNA